MSASAADARAITRRLLQVFPKPRLELEFSNPLELLVATMLSAQSTDERVNRVTRDLFRKYRNADDYARARVQTLEKDIRSSGFYKVKARRLKECGRMLVDQYAGHVPGTLEELTRLPGVGRKTANMVLGNAFGKQTIAVDTHVLRVSNRLGLVRSKDAAEVEQALLEQVPRNRRTAFTNAMILHGRRICTARRPTCCECTLYEYCHWAEKPRCADAQGTEGRSA